MTKRLEAVKAFYATLNPEQQKVFDAETLHQHHEGHMGKRGQHGPQNHPGMKG
jgi:Spy/CpxP family protein refolding chaperone